MTTEGRDSCSAETEPTNPGYGSTSCCLSDRKFRWRGGMALAGGMIFRWHSDDNCDSFQPYGGCHTYPYMVSEEHRVMMHRCMMYL